MKPPLRSPLTMEEFKEPIAQSGNRYVRFRTAYQLVEKWDFFEEARKGLNNPHGARCNYTSEKFFNMMTRTTLMDEKGLVLMLTSKNGKPLGCGVAFAAQDFEGESCFYVWTCYTSGKCRSTLHDLLEYTSAYAKHLGFDAIKLATPRITGGAFRLFEDKLGFKRSFIAFTRKII